MFKAKFVAEFGSLVAGTPVNVIEIDEETARWSLVALERMLKVR